MAESKKKQADHQEDQNLHLEQINQQLQSYLLAQHQQQQRLQEQMRSNVAPRPQITAEPVRPSPELSDYLFAQSLLAQHKAQTGQDDAAPAVSTQPALAAPAPSPPRRQSAPSMRPAVDDLYAEGVQEVFGKRQQQLAAGQAQAPIQQPEPEARPSAPAIPAPLMTPLQMTGSAIQHALDINALGIAYSKLPMAMRNRKFGRPSFHDHSQAGISADNKTIVVAQ